MNDITLTSPSRPKFFVPERPALDSGVERYVLKGGGTAAFELEAGDRIELSPLEGGQSVDVVVFEPNGRSDLAALGLKAHGGVAGIQKILASDSEDAARVRF